MPEQAAERRTHTAGESALAMGDGGYLAPVLTLLN